MAKSREEYSEDLESKYKRLERLHNSIVEEFESSVRSKSSQEMLDAVYSFFITCYHLREHIRKDNKVSQEIRDTIPTFEKADSPIQFLMCRDLANRNKHATFWGRYKPNDPNTKIIPYGEAIFRVSTKEIEEASRKNETVHLKSEDSIFLGNFVVLFKGKQYDLKGVVQGCMHVWKKFFEENDLLLPRSTLYVK